MASPGGIRAGRAFVELAANDRRFSEALTKAQRQLSAFGATAQRIGRNMMLAGTAISAPFLASIAIFGKVGDSLDKASKRTGIAVESLSELNFAAEQSGASAQVLENSVRVMNRTLADAADGSATAVQALNMVGLAVEDLSGMSPEQRFIAISDALSKIQDPGERAAASMRLFGRTGTQLLPMLADGASGIERLRQEARDLGLTISTETAEKAAEFTDSLNRLRRVIVVTAVNVGALFGPAISGITTALAKSGRAVNDFVGRNRVLIVTVAVVGASLVAVGGTLVAIGISAKVAAFAIGTLVSAVAMLKVALGAVLFIFGAMTAPATIIIGLVVGLGAALVHHSGAGSKALQWLSDNFRKLAETAGPTIQGIGDALAAKNIPLAANILFKGLEVAWTAGVQTLRGVWSDFLLWMMRSMTQAAAIAASVMELAKGGTQSLLNWVNDKAENLMFGAVSVWDQAGGGYGDLGRQMRENRDAERQVRDDALVDDVTRKLAEIEERRQERLAKILDGSQTAESMDRAAEEMRKLQDELAALLEEARKAREEERDRSVQRAAMAIDEESMMGMLGGGPGTRVGGTFGSTRAALASINSQSPLLKPVIDIAKTVRNIERRFDDSGTLTFF